MKIVFVCSELAPYVKTGGLADVTASLAHELQALGHEVYVFCPRYRSVDLDKGKFRLITDSMVISLGNDREQGRVFTAASEKGVKIYAIDHPEYYLRDGLYGTSFGDYPDNDRRFTFFQKAVLETMRVIGLVPDIFHCHDWQTGLIPAYLKTNDLWGRFFKKSKTLFTVHNLAFQGNFPPDSLPLTGLDWEEFKFDRLEFYGKISFLKSGLVYSDAVSTVSEHYAREIQEEEFGCGMAGVLKGRKDSLFGVLNGIDFDEWNPATDPDIAAPFSAKDIDKKYANKAALQKENDFEINPKIPLIGLITRLVDAKGIHIVIAAMEKFPELGVQFVLLGTGDEKYHRVLREIAKKNKEHFGFHIVFDPGMAKRIYAGSDIIVVPSYTEPCGLGQIIAPRFGAVPVVHKTGGLADAVCEFDPASGQGNGFVFDEFTGDGVLLALQRALKIYKNPKEWRSLVQNCMNYDSSWKAAAEKYLTIYDKVRSVKSKRTGG